MKANFTLPNGATIAVEGTVEEVQAVADHAATYPPIGSMPPKDMRSSGGGRPAWTPPITPGNGDVEEPPELNIASVVSIIKDCPEAEQIQARVLDQQPLNAVNRTLLCLWAVSRYVSDQLGITSGDVEKITNQLGVKLDIATASKVLSDRAKAFVSGDTVRRKGGAVRYRLNRRGITEFERILNNGQSG